MTDPCYRYGDFTYSEKANALAEMLWDETVAELDFAKISDILTSIKRQTKEVTF